MKFKVIQTDQAPAAIGPYVQALQGSGWTVLSGQIPLRPDGSLVQGTIEEETAQVLANLEEILKAAGLTKEHVVKTTIYTTDLSLFGTINERYEAFFAPHRPARSTVGVAALPRGARIEIEAWAFDETERT
ncbi:MAG: deaminase [Candidatus Carbobacillus altaicus]|uniref:Endoribonuclease L-PSP n=1 Tax=Candidatus Carbonibacillus altaicus TaxID=2163959 RepID=A0A2R6Y1S7_9BACL|nr:deaminase [Candidatus Carbobacillus altaicus]PTQ56585.1 MAG: Endoribonuclease L-PSP [Candidatus Carbobacillus altaicus]